MKINGNTRVYGLLGYPISHTLSPAMHNAAFSHLGLNAVYLPFEVRPEELKDVLKALVAIGAGGLNVTIPHKESCIQYLDGLDKQAKSIGAVNTIVIKKGRLWGYNTDCKGFLKSLKRDLGLQPRDLRVFILGAGGGARAVVTGLAMGGAKQILVKDLIYTRAKRLVGDIRKHFPNCQAEVTKGLPGSELETVDLLVNATPVGMKKDDPLLVEPKFLHPRLKVYDLVYNPPHTKLLRAAKARGLQACGGLGMLLYQGAYAFELWTGKKAPVEVMRKALKKVLKET